ncbi:TonB-dependent receptor plug domain-containing protein [Acanthopleuribacter pedis]|uniref:TonB-dependent receptor n=1 Tax=Acanthopleuribacter pedis TaxID=442870 RepID=A0A8J7U5B7_9BACT|nr:TonB-dependent receptor [Acanthopleuribacter pedis]MBO1320278.1 TonB-dependent receptor [Acanthopleuribacter pedis]
MSLESLLQIEVTSASKFAQNPREAPSVITLTTAEQIDRYGWQSINDILYKMPGFGPGQDFDRPTVPTRGLFDSWSNNHLLHLVDGIPMNGILYGTAFTWEITPIFNAKTIEIIRGPGSALYGSNATNGVVQVNTVSAADLDKKVDIRLRTGSFNSQQADLLAAHDGEEFSAVISFSGHTTNGWEYDTLDGSGRFDAAGNPEVFRNRNQKENLYAWAKVEGKERFEGFSFQYHQQDWDFQTGHGWLWWVPDFEEDMNQQRRVFALKYAPTPKGKLNQEYLVRFERQDVSWNQRYYPDGAFEDYYPSGMWEFLDTDAEEVFVRVQFGYELGKNARVLAGFEGDRFLYKGDTEHFSNVDVNDPFFAPFPGDVNTALGPWLEYIIDEPLINTGFYAQFSSGDMINETFEVTAGLRWDESSVDFYQLGEPGRPQAEKSLSRVSPRLAAVYSMNERTTLKLMGGRAFRAPVPTELAGANTFSLASNIEELQPELITTVELMGDFILFDNINLRVNLFETEFENQIAYSTANNNLSTNVFSQTTRGLELDLVYQANQWSAFANLSLVDRVDEEVQDSTIALNEDDVAWETDTKFNFGISYTSRRWNASLAGHYHGEANRRATDIGVQELPLGVGVSLDMDRYRPQTLDSWLTADLNVEYKLSKSLTLGFRSTNLFDEDENMLIKTGPFPFDYQGEGRRTDFVMRVKF